MVGNMETQGRVCCRVVSFEEWCGGSEPRFRQKISSGIVERVLPPKKADEFGQVGPRAVAQP